MWIERITMKNWSCYEQATLMFPKPEGRRNVVLIGARNGVGKTRLLEAVTLCLFGADGVRYLSRPGASKMAYGNFLKNAFNKNTDTHNASVRMDFVQSGGTQLSIERIWHFRKDRDKGYKEEELRIEENGAVAVSSGESPDDFRRGLIAQRLLPPPLAPFFFFDSAQVQRLARSDRHMQVRLGVEGILGVPLLNELTDDLRKYAQDKRKGLGRIGDEKMDAALKEIAGLESEVRDAQKQCAGLDENIVQVQREMDGLMSEYESMDGSDMAASQKLHEDRAGLRATRVQHQTRLDDILVDEISLLLCGPNLIGATVSRLNAEIIRAKWEQTRDTGAAQFAAFIANLEKSPPEITPPLSDNQLRQLRDKLRVAWDASTNPEPEGCAKDYRHTLIGNDERASVVERLQTLRGKNAAEIVSLRSQISDLDKQIRALDIRIANVTGGNPEAAKRLGERIRACQNKIQELESEKTKQAHRRDGATGELNAKKAESRRLSEKIEAGRPQLRRANLADKFVDMIDLLIRDAYPMHVREIAEEMTAAYMKMANKEDVSKIEIDDECAVKLLDRHGNNLSAIDPSHGESQIFTLSLIAAIVAVSKNRFPFIVDTPLGALDTGHRRKFLNYFSSSVENQVILLSHNEEARKDELALLRPNLAAKILIEQEQGENGPRNVVKPGQYFPEVEQ